MFGCCLDNTELVIAPCGREYYVCTNCDNGINDCTEDQCDHEQCPSDDCEYGIEPCCDGCASGLGPCSGPGYHQVCYTHRRDA